MGDYLSAEAILACDDTQFRDEDVPQWGGVVRVRALTGKERDAYDASLREIRENGDFVYNPENQRAKLVGRTLVDPETGARLFTDQQINALGEKNAAVLQRLYDVAAKLSGLDDGSDKEAEGNSEAAPSGDSGSTSPVS